MDSLRDAQGVYFDLMDIADPRVKDWFLMSSPWPCLTIIFLYYILIKIGPLIMTNRKPMELRNVLVFYNVFMVMMTGYCGFQFLWYGWLNGYSLGCQPVDYSDSPDALWIAKVSWLFFISKLLELLDTVFFVLRKKFSQASFLHVSHHCLMPFAIWCGVKFVAGGFSTFFPMINSFVHTIMYTYYGLAALGPSYQKYLWWKKYMTKIQIAQFTVMIVHASQLFFIECDYPKFFAWWTGLGAVFYGTLFTNFYIQAYLKSRNEHSNKRQ